MEQHTDGVSQLTKLKEYEFQPKVHDYDSLLSYCKNIQAVAAANLNGTRSKVLSELRCGLAREMSEPSDDEQVASLFVRSVLLDLLSQDDWSVEVRDRKVKLSCETAVEESMAVKKDRVRRGHLIDRDSQLQQSAVAEFLNRMERLRLHPSNGWVSIHSLMRDGQPLAEVLREVPVGSTNGDNHRRLQDAISPYLQFVEPDSICEHTGLRLMDIWRYFRHTWVNSYKSLPGRSIMILVRDAAAPFHPIIGIAALGSSIVQQSARDSSIGWRTADFVQKVVSTPTASTAKWALACLDDLIKGIYVKDLIAEEVFQRSDIARPTKGGIARLRDEARKAISRHRLYPRRQFHKPKEGFGSNINWAARAKTDLFRSKRCHTLATLLNVRGTFFESGLKSGTRNELKKASESAGFRNALGQLVRMIKAGHVGIDMMDIVVCGAVAPYNLLLGGKLVCLMLCSPEVVSYYSKKYDGRVSIIASSVAGKAIQRKPNLVFLGTTSLYGFGSSQYNRIKVNASAVGGQSQHILEYKKLGLSEGYGSFHFSKDTLHLMETLLARTNKNRMVNSIFGEGVNPLMRKIRQALDYVGLPSDLLLKHGNQRVIYGVPLASNFSEILLGQASRPKYFLPLRGAKDKTEALAEFWRKRWLSSRLNYPGILDQVAKHTLSRPIRHGAAVPRQRDPDIPYLWD